MGNNSTKPGPPATVNSEIVEIYTQASAPDGSTRASSIGDEDRYATSEPRPLDNRGSTPWARRHSSTQDETTPPPQNDNCDLRKDGYIGLNAEHSGPKRDVEEAERHGESKQEDLQTIDREIALSTTPSLLSFAYPMPSLMSTAPPTLSNMPSLLTSGQTMPTLMGLRSSLPDRPRSQNSTRLRLFDDRDDEEPVEDDTVRAVKRRKSHHFDTDQDGST